MNKQVLFLLMVCVGSRPVSAQVQAAARTQQWVDFSLAGGGHEGTAAFSYVYNWGIGKSKKLGVGVGARWTGYLGHDKAFYTAPGKYARSTTTPFTIVFAGHTEQNIDTLTLATPFTGALNLSLNGGYRFSRRWYAGANIDLIGLTAGSRTHGILKSNGKEITEPSAKPSTINVLLTGDNDYGSLNSEFFIRYRLAAGWEIKAVYQFAFSEYKTETIHQTTPDGHAVFRFRNKANLFGVGVVYAW